MVMSVLRDLNSKSLDQEDTTVTLLLTSRELIVILTITVSQALELKLDVQLELSVHLTHLEEPSVEKDLKYNLLVELILVSLALRDTTTLTQLLLVRLVQPVIYVMVNHQLLLLTQLEVLIQLRQLIRILTMEKSVQRDTIVQKEVTLLLLAQ